MENHYPSLPTLDCLGILDIIIMAFAFKLKLWKKMLALYNLFNNKTLYIRLMWITVWTNIGLEYAF